MKLERNSKAAAVLVGGLGLAVITGGTAYAYWTTTGTGTGSASATTAQLIAGTSTATAAGLYPGAIGANAKTGTVTISNPNPFPVTVTAATPTITVEAPHAAAGCTIAGVTVTPGTLPTVPAKTTTDGTAPLSFTAAMTNDSPNACQGATFAIVFALQGQS